MPSFPTSVFAPTTKTTGQTIAAAHVNDLQDEVVAIAGGYLNGTARLNSSNSTMVSLTIGGAAVHGSESARLQFEATQEIAADSTAALAWSNQVFITNASIHSTTTNPTRITPQTTGVYLFIAQVGLRSASSRSEIAIVDSSETIVAFAEKATGSTASAFTYSAQGMKRFDVLGGYVRAVVVSRGTTNSVSTSVTHFCMARV